MFLTPYFYVKWFMDLSVKFSVIKLLEESTRESLRSLKVNRNFIKILEESIGSNLYDISHSYSFLDMSPETRGGKQK